MLRSDVRVNWNFMIMSFSSGVCLLTVRLSGFYASHQALLHIITGSMDRWFNEWAWFNGSWFNGSEVLGFAVTNAPERTYIDILEKSLSFC